MTRIVERNTTIPTKRSQVFTTAADMQTTVTIHILQGERPMASDCISLGMFNLTGIPPAPRGIPQIEVTFDIDASGILNVSAKDTATGNEQKITITASTKLDEATKNRMMKEGEQFAQQDRIKKEEADTRNNADTLLYTVEKTKKDFADKIKKEDVERIDKAASDLRTALSGPDFGVIKASMDSLSRLLQEVGSTMYQKSTVQPK